MSSYRQSFWKAAPRFDAHASLKPPVWTICGILTSGPGCCLVWVLKCSLGYSNVQPGMRISYFLFNHLHCYNSSPEAVSKGPMADTLSFWMESWFCSWFLLLGGPGALGGLPSPQAQVESWVGDAGSLHLGNVDRGAELFVVEAGLWIEGCLAESLASPTRCQKHPQPPSGDKGKVRLWGSAVMWGCALSKIVWGNIFFIWDKGRERFSFCGMLRWCAPGPWRLWGCGIHRPGSCRSSGSASWDSTARVLPGLCSVIYS